MSCIVVHKWLEPYVILEVLKKHYEVEDLTFDSFTKNQMKQKMLLKIQESETNSFGVYMKNLNKFYVFNSDKNIDKNFIISLFELKNEDYYETDNEDEAVSAIDMAKAEVSFIF